MIKWIFLAVVLLFGHLLVSGQPACLHIESGVEFSVALREDSSLWSWGYNFNGQLGLGDVTQRNVPTRIGSASNWKAISAGGFYCLGLKSDGTLWSWGYNGEGELGIGTTTDQVSPVQVGTDTDWSVISAGRLHSLAIKTDGSLWSWGYNVNGQLGIGSTETALTPQQIGTDTDWRFVSTGGAHSLAIKSDGSLWSWGLHSSGQLGFPASDLQLTPVQVGTATDWAMVSAGLIHSVGLKTNGTVWVWGNNQYDQLGLDAPELFIDTVTPIASLTHIAFVNAGSLNSFAIDSTGELYGWGGNFYGELGLGNTTQQPLPVVIDAGDPWKAVAAAEGHVFSGMVYGYHTAGIKTSGSICTVGMNVTGQLGIGSTTDQVWFSCDLEYGDLSAETSLQASPLTLHPNPSSGKVFLHHPYTTATNWLTVTAADGKTAVRLPLQQSGEMYDFSQLERGVYVLQVDGETHEQPVRLIID